MSLATISVVLVIVGFILSVYAGVVLSLSGKMQTKDGELNQGQISLFSIIMTISVLMILSGVLGYYWLRGNLPYYMN